MLQLYSKSAMAYGEMPFEVDESQVVFFDNGVPHPLNLYVAGHLADIKRTFARCGLQFCYISDFRQDGEALEDQILYRVPWLRNVDPARLEQLKSVTYAELRDTIRAKAKEDSAIYLGQTEKAVMKIDVTRPEMYGVQFELIAAEYGNKVCRSHIEQQYESSRELKQLIRELALKQPKGAVREIIENALQDEEVLSRVVIHRTGGVSLPDYNIEINLRPMEKTLFILYLRHPEGIAFKDLVDYKKEISHIYSHLTNQSEPELITATVDRLFELDSNAINEHRSRLKNAFEREFDSTLASNYYITGRKGEKMNITLPRNLVDWEVKL